MKKRRDGWPAKKSTTTQGEPCFAPRSFLDSCQCSALSGSLHLRPTVVSSLCTYLRGSFLGQGPCLYIVMCPKTNSSATLGRSHRLTLCFRCTPLNVEAGPVGPNPRKKGLRVFRSGQRCRRPSCFAFSATLLCTYSPETLAEVQKRDI